MGDKSLPDRLREVADLAGADLTPPDAALFGKRRRAHRRLPVAVIAVAAVVVAVVAAGVVIDGAAHHPRAAGGAGSLPPPTVQPTPGHVTVAELQRYRWGTLPDAPIPARSDGVAAVWTGSAMLVWGGDSTNGTRESDGASYDPNSRTWTKMPASPLQPRTNPAYTWTGTSLFIWGGTRSGDANLSDGALFIPATQSWRTLPPLAIQDDANPVAVWTGSRVVLFTTVPTSPATSIDVHAYNPANNSWTSLPSIHITQTTVLGISALVAGNQLYVWAPVQTVNNNGLRTGNDGFRYQPAANTWQTTALLPTQTQYSVGDALWTGDHIIFEPSGLDCTCGGLPGATTGSWADPRSGAVTAVPAWQSDPLSSSTFLWTGTAILALGNARAAAWNPSTQHWTDLAPPPFQGGAVQIWTGKQLLVWGQLSALPSTDPNAGSAPPVTEPTGLELIP